MVEGVVKSDLRFDRLEDPHSHEFAYLPEYRLKGIQSVSVVFLGLDEAGRSVTAVLVGLIMQSGFGL